MKCLIWHVTVYWKIDWIEWFDNFLSGFPSPGSTPLLPAIRIRSSSLRGQTCCFGHDEINPGDPAFPVFRVPSWGFEFGLPPADQQPLPAACGAPARQPKSHHDILTQKERTLGASVRLFVCLLPSQTYISWPHAWIQYCWPIYWVHIIHDKQLPNECIRYIELLCVLLLCGCTGLICVCIEFTIIH